jgi:hypothetical protein
MGLIRVCDRTFQYMCRNNGEFGVQGRVLTGLGADMSSLSGFAVSLVTEAGASLWFDARDAPLPPNCCLSRSASLAVP